MDSIVIYNDRTVKNFLGCEVESMEDLLEHPKYNDFVKKYYKYFESNKKEDFNQFYKETGIVLSHYYYGKNYSPLLFIVFNSLGCNLESPLEYPIYNHHLLTFTKVDELKQVGNKIYADGKEIYILTDNLEVKDKELEYKIIRNKLSIEYSVQSQIKIIKEKYKEYNFLDDVKQIYLSSFGDLYILYENGTLYQNEIEYANNVEAIWEANSYTTYLIFKDNFVEYISSSIITTNRFFCKEILYTDNYIAFLYEDDKLEIISRLEQPDSICYNTFQGVSAINYAQIDTDIVLQVGDGQIIYHTTTYLETFD